MAVKPEGPPNQVFRDGIGFDARPLLRRVARQALCQLFVLYVAANMALCAIVFAPWALPRETVSGLLGRWKVRKTGWRRRFAVAASWVVDRIYFWEPNHCVAVYLCEHDARAVLYPEKPGAMP
jgi:hypothetical protein